MKTMLRDFNVQWKRVYIFKPTIRNDSIHQDSNDNGVRIVNIIFLFIYCIHGITPSLWRLISYLHLA